MLLLGTLGWILCVVRFVRGRWGSLVHWNAPSGSLGVAEFIAVRPGGRRIRSVVLGYLECRRGRSVSLVSFRCAVLFVMFVRGLWVDCGSSWETSAVDGFIGVRPGGGGVRSRSLRGALWCYRVCSASLGSLGSRQCPLGSLVCALRFVGIVRGPCVHWGTP